MKIRKPELLLAALVTGGVSAPALADCCSGFWSCAATVVTEGVSCEVQTIIDTILALQAEVNNFFNDVNGTTSNEEQAARQSVTDQYNALQSGSQQSSSDLAAALSQAKALYAEESVILPVKSATVNTQDLAAAGPTLASGAPTSAGRPAAMESLHSQAFSQPAAPANPLLQKGTVTADTAVKSVVVDPPAPHGAYADAFSRGVKQLATLQARGAADLTTVNAYLAQAQSTEGPGVAAADTVAGVLTSPVTNLLSQLSQMLTHPLDAFDPSSMVDDMEKSLGTAMSADIPKMVNDITAGPDQAFTAAGPAFDDLQNTANAAQQLSTAMANLYRLRNSSAATAVYSLLPQVSYAGLTTRAPSATIAANPEQVLTSASIAAKAAATRSKLLTIHALPSVAKLNALVVQLKNQRAQGRAPIAQALMVNYKSTLASQLNGYFNGKSPAAIASQRDQLIAQARSQYAKDPATATGVIALLNSEAAKRGVATNATATAPPIPGQPVPTLASQATSPGKPPAPTWGAAPAAWSPAATTGPSMTTVAPSTFKATTSLKSLQTTQQPGQQSSTLQAAPSSLSH